MQSPLTEAIRNLDADPLELLESVVAAFATLLGADSGCAHVTDPASGAPIGSVRIADPAGSFEQAFAFEYRRPDAMPFADLARRARHGSSLGLETGGEPARSARFREMIEPAGAADELRASFTDAFGTWGTMVLFRRRRFEPHEVSLVADAVPAVSGSLRAARTRERTADEVDQRVSVVVLDGADRVVSADALGRQRIADLRGSVDGPLPPTFFMVAAEARERRPGVADRALARSAAGRWLALEGSPLDDERHGAVAVVVRPASDDGVADLVLRAHGLSAREREVARLALRGRSAKAIAAELALSPYTVEDHLRSAYDKTRARSREGLLALTRR